MGQAVVAGAEPEAVGVNEVAIEAAGYEAAAEPVAEGLAARETQSRSRL